MALFYYPKKRQLRHGNENINILRNQLTNAIAF
jgi:hypothetical protein